MEWNKRKDIEVINLPGRQIQNCVGRNGIIKSEKMTVGFARYAPECGPMEPHHHAEETVYILDAKNGWVRYGNSKDNLDKKVDLEAGVSLHFEELEWHVFEYGEGGYIDALVIYGQVDNIRPEEILNK